MRVAMLVRCLSMMHGGGETRHLAWAQALRRAGDEVILVTGRPLFASARFEAPPPAVVLRSPYVRDLVYRFQETRGCGRLLAAMLHADEEWFCRAAWREIAQWPNPPDIVHAHALYQAARLRRGAIPTVINLPGLPSKRYFDDLQAADALVADGWAAANLPAIVCREVDGVPKGVDTDRFRPDGADLRASLGLAGKRVALVVSRMVPIKNVALAIDAMGGAAPDCPHLVLVIVGDGPLRATLEARVTSLGLGGRVIFAGRVDHNRVPEWYRSADLLVLPSAFDNSPNVVLEAMATGLPVVATDVGGLREYVAPGVNGDLVPPRDPRALASAMVRYARDTDLARRCGRRNRDDAVSRYSWAESARVLRGVYERVVERRRHAALRAYRATA